MSGIILIYEWLLITDKDEKKSSARGGSEWKHGKAKRVRTIFTPEQLERLEAEFERQQYMVGTERWVYAGRTRGNSAFPTRYVSIPHSTFR